MTSVLKLSKNTTGRDFTVGDIHGSFFLLEKALEAAGFNPGTDRVICVGDLVNRGPESRRALEFLDQDWFFSLRGNHDNDISRHITQMNLKGRAAVREEFEKAGRGWLLDLTSDEQAIYSMKLRSLPFAIEVQMNDGSTAGFVHAEVPEEQSWPEFLTLIEQGCPETREAAIRQRKRIVAAHNDNAVKLNVEGIDRLFSGHTLAPNRGPLVSGNWCLLDTGASNRALNARDKTFPDVPVADYHLTLADVSADLETLAKKKSHSDDKPFHVVTRAQ